MTWATRTSGLTDRLRAVAYDNGLWVATGNVGKITTSPDGINMDTKDFWS